MKTIIVCGSRKFSDEAMLVRECCAVSPGGMTEKVRWVHGGCPTGADAIADRLPGEKRVYEADWSTFGKSAGPRRNRAMAETSGATLCLAFLVIGKPNTGTKNMIECAKKAGIPVLEFWQ